MEVNRLDSEDNNMVNGLFFVCHSRKLNKGPYSICVSRKGNVQHWCGTVKLDPSCSWQGHSGKVVTNVRD